MDICDAASETENLFLALALRARRPTDPNQMCEFCEEKPVEVYANGAHGRFCRECAPIALGAAA
jgi:hypothetical protein